MARTSRRAAAGLLTIAGLTAATTPAAAAVQDYTTGVCADADRGVFTDVPATSYAGPAVDCLAAFDIVNGYVDGTYRGQQPVDRAAAAVYVARVVQHLTGPLDSAEPAPFDDLDAVTDDEATAIAALHAAEVVHGLTATRYGPDEVLTRGQAASLLVRAHGVFVQNTTVDAPATPIAGLPVGVDAYGDDDGNVHEWPLNSLTAAGIMQGVQPAVVRPNDPLTRAQLALIVARYVQYADSTRTVDESDLLPLATVSADATRQQLAEYGYGTRDMLDPCDAFYSTDALRVDGVGQLVFGNPDPTVRQEVASYVDEAAAQAAVAEIASTVQRCEGPQQTSDGEYRAYSVAGPLAAGDGGVLIRATYGEDNLDLFPWTIAVVAVDDMVTIIEVNGGSDGNEQPGQPSPWNAEAERLAAEAAEHLRA